MPKARKGSTEYHCGAAGVELLEADLLLELHAVSATMPTVATATTPAVRIECFMKVPLLIWIDR